jgi:hypothetical protein
VYTAHRLHNDSNFNVVRAIRCDEAQISMCVQDKTRDLPYHMGPFYKSRDVCDHQCRPTVC